MSGWRKFKGSKKTAGTAISRTVEREFMRDVEKLAQLDDNAKKIQKNQKKCCDCYLAESKVGTKMAENFANSPLCQNNAELKPFAEEWHKAQARIERQSQELTVNSQKAMVEPMKKFRTIFPSVQVAVKKREQALQEYEKWLAKVDKYKSRDRTGANVVKLDIGKKSLARAKDDFTTQNKRLQEELPKLYEYRVDYMRPSFQAVVKSQINYYAESHMILSELSDNMNGKKDKWTDEEYEKHVQDKMAQIKALSITSDD